MTCRAGQANLSISTAAPSVSPVGSSNTLIHSAGNGIGSTETAPTGYTKPTNGELTTPTASATDVTYTLAHGAGATGTVSGTLSSSTSNFAHLVSFPDALPNVIKTFSFATTAESFVATAGASSTLSYDSATGDPAGALKARILGRNKADTDYWEWTGTWEDLGVPTGATVTNVQLLSAQTRLHRIHDRREFHDRPLPTP